MRQTIISLLTLVLCSNLFGQGQIINIPGDLPTIQEGINAAEDGDTVLVADGRYFENINFNGKAVTLASWFLIDDDKSHIDNTIIDGSQHTNPNIGSVVRFVSDEDTTSVLYGFTITGGSGTYTSWQNIRGGGGIEISDAGAKIQYNKIVFNSIVYEHPIGGGIAMKFPSHPIIITNNTISNNSAVSTQYPNAAGGIMCYSGKQQYVLIADNIISHNTVSSPGLYPVGGGIDVFNSKPVIINNLFAYNSAGNGGGMYITSHENGAKPTVINNTFVNNSAYNSGGGICVNSGDKNTEFIFENCIVWGNSNLADNQISSEEKIENIVVEYSDVEGGYEGIGNIDLDPLFVDTTKLYLDLSSPCVDAGNPDSHYYDNPDTNKPGHALFPALGLLRNDMGYCGGNPKMASPTTPVEQENDILPKMYFLSQNYPNPFNPETTINYSIPKAANSEWSMVNLKIYDLLGREIATLVQGYQRAGHYEVNWDGANLSSGIYLYTLRTGNYTSTKKMVLMK